jgi:hypothetical protein
MASGAPPIKPTVRRLRLRAGDLVRVRSAEEILRTLGADGTVNGLPFMPEMLAHCGRQFRVFKTQKRTSKRRFRPTGRIVGSGSTSRW